VPPTRKYENEGGPGAIAIVDLLRTYSREREEDVASFLDALTLNWLIAATDAHAKNYSLLIGAGGRVRLAPLYDVAGILPYDEFDYQKLKLAMRIGRQYRLRDIGGREWRRLAGDLRLDPEIILRRVVELADRLPDEAAGVRERMLSEGLEHRIIARLSKRVSEHAIRCSKILKAEIGT
jgi:serine/threonine-protein kinase HipA